MISTHQNKPFHNMDLTYSILILIVVVLNSHFSITNVRRTRVLLNDPNFFDARISQLESLVHEQAARIKQLETEKGTNGGATFVHWGSASCPNDTSETVYSGFAAGGWYYDEGSGVNYLCLPDDPSFGSRTTVMPQHVNFVYGAEYESNFFGINSWSKDAPCAVCRSVTDSSSLMVPGRDTCYSGWTQQYSGYVASGYYLHKAQYEFVCVDIHAEYRFGGNADDNGALFYPVVSICGSLPCPPYRNSTPLACVVCTK